MRQVIKLKESELTNIVANIINEQSSDRTTKIQKILKQKGYGKLLGTTGPNKDGIDGVYGQNTVNAVKAFQKDNKIKETGYVGKLTGSALGLDVVTPTKTTTKTPTPKVTTKDPKDINSYPACVRFGDPINTSKGVYKLLNSLGADYGQWQIVGKKFYEGYFFFNNGKYVSLKTNKTGTYRCDGNGKLMLDIADKANDKNTLKSGDYKYSPRIDAEITHIKNRKLDSTPFFIHDPKDNLLYLFDVGGKYIASTSVVDGADTQKGLSDAKVFSMEDWCKVSGFDSVPHICTNPKTKEKAQPYYGPIAAASARFIPKGIYTIKGLTRHEGYVGSGKNQWNLKPLKLDGTITAAATKHMSAAIHGIPNISERLTASKELQDKLQSDINSGKVPTKYLDSVKAILNANQSFGCIGVPASFVDSPKIQSILKKGGVNVFAMGEGSDMLVKNDTPNNNGTDVMAESELNELIKESIVKVLR